MLFIWPEKTERQLQKQQHQQQYRAVQYEKKLELGQIDEKMRERKSNSKTVQQEMMTMMVSLWITQAICIK